MVLEAFLFQAWKHYKLEMSHAPGIYNILHQLLGGGLEDNLNAVCQTVLQKENNTRRKLQLIMLSFMIWDHGEEKKKKHL